MCGEHMASMLEDVGGAKRWTGECVVGLDRTAVGSVSNGGRVSQLSAQLGSEQPVRITPVRSEERQSIRCNQPTPCRPQTSGLHSQALPGSASVVQKVKVRGNGGDDPIPRRARCQDAVMQEQGTLLTSCPVDPVLSCPHQYCTVHVHDMYSTQADDSTWKKHVKRTGRSNSKVTLAYGFWCVAQANQWLGKATSDGIQCPNDAGTIFGIEIWGLPWYDHT
jgi:hypothetical protein